MNENLNKADRDKPLPLNLVSDGYSDGELVYDIAECTNCGRTIYLYYEEHYKKYKELTPLNLSLAEFFVNNGVICSIKEVKDFLRKFEKDEIIIINRDPQKTRTGKESTFMNEDQQKKVYLKWNES